MPRSSRNLVMYRSLYNPFLVQDKFVVRPLKNSPEEIMAALSLQVSIVSQALIFVTRPRSWSFAERKFKWRVYAAKNRNARRRKKASKGRFKRRISAAKNSKPKKTAPLGKKASKGQYVCELDGKRFDSRKAVTIHLVNKHNHNGPFCGSCGNPKHPGRQCRFWGMKSKQRKDMLVEERRQGKK